MLSLKIDDMYLEAMYTPYIKYDKKDFNPECDCIGFLYYNACEWREQ